MKNKIYTIISCFIICTLLLMTPCFAVEIDAKNRVNEKTSDYGDGAIIYGSTRFDPLKLITADDAFDAGVNESRLTIALGKSLSDIKPVTPYYFNGASWYEITKDEEEPVKPITDKDDIAKIENNLNIFFVDNVEKTIEVTYDGTVDSINNKNVKYDPVKKIFVVPATTFNFTFEDSNGVETKVNTNVDTNLELEAGEEPEKPAIKRNPEVEFELAKEIVAGEPTIFKVSTVANDYAGVMVVGTGSVNPDNVLKLEYAVGDQWIDMTGESLFGNDGEGFPLQNATSIFRVTFSESGEYDVTFAIKNLDTKTIMAEVATKTNVTTTKNVKTLEELETALLNKYITNINILSDIETDHSIVVGRKVTINGNNKTISFKEMPKEWEEGKNNYVLKVYNTEATISDIKLTNSLAGLWVGSSNVILTGKIDVTGNKKGGIDVSKSSNEGMPNSTLTVNGTIKRDDEAIDRPIMWLENGEGSVEYNNNLFVANTNIPSACALNQTYYYSSADVYKNVEVSNAEELETAMFLSDVENIKLLNNIELVNVLVVERALTLNLNGKTIYNEKDIWQDTPEIDDWSLISVRKGGNLTIYGDGTLKAKEKDCYAIDVQHSGAVIIEDGTYIGNISAVYVSEGTATIKGGSYSIQQLSNVFEDHRYTLNCLDASNKTNKAVINVEGGTFIEFNPACSDSENPKKNFLANGYKVVKSEVEKENNKKQTVYTVTKVADTDVILADGMVCSDLQTAVDTASNVKLLKDIELEKCLVVTKKVTLDLNGNTIKNETVIYNEETKSWSLISVRGKDGNLTITGNGTLQAMKDDCFAVDVKEAGKLTIEDGNYIGNLTAIYVHTGTATINGGTYSIQQTASGGNGYRYTLNCLDANYKNGSAKILVTGGTFVKYDPANSSSEYPVRAFVVSGYISAVDDNGNYNVSKELVSES